MHMEEQREAVGLTDFGLANEPTCQGRQEVSPDGKKDFQICVFEDLRHTWKRSVLALRGLTLLSCAVGHRRRWSVDNKRL